MKTKFLPLIASVLFVTSLISCKKSTVAAASTTTTTLVVTVNDGVTKSPSSGATVNLYENAGAALAGGIPNLTLVTNQSGVATFTVTDITTYYVVAINGAKKNYYNGLLPIGNVNGVVSFQDTNGDGIISALDDVNAPGISVVPAGATYSTSTIIY